MVLTSACTQIIPVELVELIIDFIDYQKYHKRLFKYTLNDINLISTIFDNENNMLPEICYVCWGIGWRQYTINTNTYFLDDPPHGT